MLLQKCNTLGENLFDDITDIMQPVDDPAVGNRLKKLVNEERNDYINADKDNFDRLVTMEAWQKRVLYTQFVGRAYLRLLETMNAPAVFYNMGYTLPTDGSKDSELKLRALPGLAHPDEAPVIPNRLSKKE